MKSQMRDATPLSFDTNSSTTTSKSRLKKKINTPPIINTQTVFARASLRAEMEADERVAALEQPDGDVVAATSHAKEDKELHHAPVTGRPVGVRRTDLSATRAGSGVPQPRGVRGAEEDDELFERNPRGISGFYRAKARIPHGTEVEVPYTYGPETLGIPGQPGFEPCQIKVEEILSLRRLIHEGKQLGNCLEDRYQSQVKYILRARQRSSSYWSMTAVRPNGDVDFLGLIEVWHVGGNRNIVHQFEGPRPRTLPLAEGWWWLQGWCEQEDIDWTTWNCYS